MNQLVTIREKTLTGVKGYSNDPRMSQILADYLSALERYMTTDKILTLEAKGRVVAFFMPSKFFHRFYGQVLTQYVFDYDGEYEAESVSFLNDCLKQHRNQTTIELIEAYSGHEAFRRSLESDWELAATCYAGDPAVALAAMKSNRDLRNIDFEIRPIRDESDVDRIMQLKISAFKKNPSLCWFWTCEKYQTNEYLRLVNSIGKEQSFGLFHKETIIGYVGVQFDFESAYWGPVSGIDIAVDEKYQSQGLSYHLYRHAFSNMTSSGIKLYKGVTANQAVIKMTKLFARWPIYHQIIPKK
ncbi:MAG: GNAT family N-acetyltransferase [Pseudobacteriovorax sp.]|nr:GNAT family N-acetyltransferase [Pseudobacteriovorax sp.]